MTTNAGTGIPGDQRSGQLSPPEVGRATLWALAFLAVLAVAGLVGVVPSLPTTPPPARPQPIYAATDGLPATLVAGRTYTATYHVTLPHRWPQQHTNFATVLETPGGGLLIECGHGYETVARQTITLKCPLRASTAGETVIHFGVDLDFRLAMAGTDTTPAYNEAVYRHTVVAP